MILLRLQDPNITPSLLELLKSFAAPNYVTCWVSPYCFLPTDALAKLQPLIAAPVQHELLGQL